MSLRISDLQEEMGNTYVLPHQPVIRLDSITTKLCVVFDASAKTSLGISLSDKLVTGPDLQNDLVDILMRFRTHEFVVTANIKAMYRQIWIREEDRDLQRILWRQDSKQPMQLYKLNTVTYGEAPAPYLAIRCLRQLAIKDSQFPRAAAAIERDIYMDDVLTGERTKERAIALRQEISQILQRGSVFLRKWRLNDVKILEDLPQDDKIDELLKIDKKGALKTLGLLWNAGKDILQYKVNIEHSPKTTKRAVLSAIAQIFDPLGLLGPVLVNAKIILQSMWKLQND